MFEKLSSLFYQPHKRFVFVVICLLSILQYWQTLTFDEYILDDQLYVSGNQYVKNGLGCALDQENRLSWDCISENFKNIWGQDVLMGFFNKDNVGGLAGGRFRPLSLYTFAIEYEIFKGPSPRFSHLINLLLYIGINYAIFLLSAQLFKRFNYPAYLALVVTCIFCVHPLHVEVVANIKGRMEMMSALFGLMGLFIMMRFNETNKPVQLFLAGLSLFIGMLSKEEIITFLAVIPMITYLQKSSYTSSLRTFGLLSIPFIAYFLIRALVFGSALNLESDSAASNVSLLLNEPFLHASATEKIATIFSTWWRYIELLVVPHPLTHDYYPNHIEIVNLTNPRAILGLGLVIASVIGFFKFWKNHQLLSFAILWFWATFSITSNLVFNIGTFMNERFMFLPSFGFILFAVTVLFNFIKRQEQLRIPFIAVCLTFIFLSFNRAQAWESSFELFKTDIQVSQNSIKSNMEFAEVLIEQFETGRDFNDLVRAVACLERIEHIDSNFVGPYDLKGKALYLKGSFDLAAQSYLGGIEILQGQNRIDLGLEQNLSICLDLALENAQVQSLENTIARAVLCLPENPDVLAQAARYYGQFKQDLVLSMRLVQQGLVIDPKHPDLLKFAFISHASSGNDLEAASFAKRALEANPNDQIFLQNLLHFFDSKGDQQSADEIRLKLNQLQ